jgi:hypothetical protein
VERKLVTVAEFAKSFPMTEAALRWHIFNAANNGLQDHRAILRIGRRVLIDPAAFDRWVDSQNPGAVRQ